MHADSSMLIKQMDKILRNNADFKYKIHISLWK